MLNHGIPVLVVSKRLGHTKPSITLDVYGRLIPSMQEKAPEVMDEVITPVVLDESVPVAPGLHREASVSSGRTEPRPPYIGKICKNDLTSGIITVTAR
jgi:hypothetical protein